MNYNLSLVIIIACSMTIPCWAAEQSNNAQKTERHFTSDFMNNELLSMQMRSRLIYRIPGDMVHIGRLIAPCSNKNPHFLTYVNAILQKPGQTKFVQDLLASPEKVTLVKRTPPSIYRLSSKTKNSKEILVQCAKMDDDNIVVDFRIFAHPDDTATFITKLKAIMVQRLQDRGTPEIRKRINDSLNYFMRQKKIIDPKKNVGAIVAHWDAILSHMAELHDQVDNYISFSNRPTSTTLDSSDKGDEKSPA